MGLVARARRQPSPVQERPRGLRGALGRPAPGPQALSRSDFAWADLKEHTATVFLVLPPERLPTYGPVVAAPDGPQGLYGLARAALERARLAGHGPDGGLQGAYEGATKIRA